MIDRVKDLLGIEGLRVRVQPEASPRLRDGLLHGTVTFTTLRPQRIRRVDVWLTERYERGWRGGKQAETLELGRLTQGGLSLVITPGEEHVVPFELRFAERLSPVETWGRSRLVLRPVASLLRAAAGVRSDFEVHAAAYVAGVKLPTGHRAEVAFG